VPATLLTSLKSSGKSVFMPARCLFSPFSVILTTLCLTACSGRGGGKITPPIAYTISGTVSGLWGMGLVLQNTLWCDHRCITELSVGATVGNVDPVPIYPLRARTRWWLLILCWLPLSAFLVGLWTYAGKYFIPPKIVAADSNPE